MTNKEKYKQTFDTLSASVNFSLEVDKMSILNRKHKLKTLAAAVAACLIVTVGTGTAYASDLGGIQRKVQLWIHGDQTTATLTINSDGSYTGTYADKDGKNKEFGGGGIAFNQDGSERSLTQEEIMEELNDNPIYTKTQKQRFEDSVALMEKGNLDLAKYNLESLNQELQGKSFEVLYNLALIYEATNNLQIANNLYNQARTLTFNVKDLDLINYGISRTNLNLEEKIKAKSQLP